MIVVTGPTGSGKTTTLATMLSILNEPTRKILTIEDPVEYEIPGINQSQVKPSIGLTFATAMRAFVRQDPDVIMVGEIRDAETAHIAIHAALTGHLVLTTLHTETAAAAVPRLIDLGIESFLLKSTLRAVVAQRLVRVLCDRCKVPHRLTAADIDKDPRFAVIGFAAGETIHEAGGCERCGGTGYRGRNGVFEILEMSEEVRKLIGPQTDSHIIDAAAMAGGMTTMLADAVAKCRAGADHRARGLPRHDDSVMRCRTIVIARSTAMANWSPARSRPSAPGDVAQRIERLGLVLVDNVTLEEGGGSAAAVFSASSTSRRPKTSPSSPATLRCCCAPARGSMTGSNCSPPTATSAGCGRWSPISARTSSPARASPKRCRGTRGCFRRCMWR